MQFLNPKLSVKLSFVNITRNFSTNSMGTILLEHKWLLARSLFQRKKHVHFQKPISVESLTL